jgi:hypothetical protein
MTHKSAAGLIFFPTLLRVSASPREKKEEWFARRRGDAEKSCGRYAAETF